ncbi:hypothetical protein [Salinigranum rubrum]|uniref:hypothetical protein n=1 Tax=Salinigranum rubrum TaxID=755307 RepID=UPI002AA2A3C3|nr:hypothetical protein [Salinigranum rubrum]
MGRRGERRARDVRGVGRERGERGRCGRVRRRRRVRRGERRRRGRGTPPTYEALGSLDGTAARAGGLLAWTLVAEKTLAQMVGFFVGDADPSTANTFRERKSAIGELRGTAESLLDEACADDDAWEAARAGADEVIEAAYADYVETLESMGIKPKNVC